MIDFVDVCQYYFLQFFWPIIKNMFNFFKKDLSGLIDMNQLYWPEVSLNWTENWWHLVDEDELRFGLQEELHNEIGKKHPLWGLNPVVFAKNDDNVLVSLNNNKFAIVHLVWHGHIDKIPDKFPATSFFQNEIDLQRHLGYDN